MDESLRVDSTPIDADEALYGDDPEWEATVAALDESSPNVYMQRCAWCQGDVADDQEVYGFGITLAGAINDDVDGPVVHIPLSERSKIIHAFCTSAHSAARQKGFHLMAMTCCENCSDELKEALGQEKDFLKVSLLR